MLKSIRVEGNTLVKGKDIDEALRGLTGENRTLNTLRQGAAAIQRCYNEAGYGGVVVYVPEQDLSSGEAVIRVVEGKLAKVTVSGNTRFDKANIRRSLPNLTEGTTPIVSAIDRDIQLANESPTKEVQVKLKAGAKPGDIDADVAVKEERPLRFLFGLENTGTNASGEYRASAGLQYANLWDRDHVGTVQYQTSPSKPSLVKIYSVGYRAPLYGLSSSIDGFYAHTSVDSGTTLTPAGPLQFTGTGDIVGLRWNLHLARRGEYDHRVIFGLDWRDYNNECVLGAFGSSGCGSAGVSMTVLPASIGYTGQMQGPKGSWGTSVTLAQNIGGSDDAHFQQARPGAERSYRVLRFSLFGALALPRDYGLQGRLNGQHSPGPLISGEQYGLGGASSVRGYQEREVAGDSGAQLSGEILSPDWGKLITKDGLGLRALLFADYGWVNNHHNTACLGTRTNCALSSVGTGIRLNMGKWLSGRLDVGHVFQDGAQKSSGSNRGHLAINLVF